jgi:hypothetical protein
MARPVVSPQLAAFPPELVRAVVLHAARDADQVALFLNTLITLVVRPAGDGTSPAPLPPPAPLPLPGWFLLELAAALQLWIWEHSGIRLHLDAGLPPAGDALRAVFCRLTAAPGEEATGEGTPLSRAVLARLAEHCGWSGQEDLGADLLLGEADEDALVDALADLIWTHRASLRRARCDRGGGAS